MSSEDTRAISYLREVYEESKRFALALLKETERLRKENARLQHALTHTSGSSAPAPPPGSERAAGEAQELAQRLRQAERENQRLHGEYRALQKQSNSLLNLYVAVQRLHGTVELKDVLAALNEIVANMVGCEKLAIFELSPGGDALLMIGSSGIDATPLREVPLDTGSAGQATRSGEVYLGGSVPGLDGSSHPTVACVPFTLNGQVSGAIAIFELLGQKQGLLSEDLELFNVLRAHVGTALYCARLHAERRGASPS